MRYVYNRRGGATEENAAPLLIEVRKIGTNKCTYINTGIKLFPNQFTKKNGFTCVNHEKAVMINIKARKIMSEVESFAYSEKCRSLEDVKDYDKKQTFNMSITDFIAKKMIDAGLTDNQLKRHRGLINHLIRFEKIVVFSDLSLEKIMLFDTHLKKTIKSQMARYKVHSYLKNYIKLAAKLGLCETNPYDDFEMRKGKNLKDPIFLVEGEIDRIRSFQTDIEKLERVRDLFIFQCFTGLSYIDLMAFSPEWIREIDGYKVFSDNRSKTNVGFLSILLPEAEAVLKKYDGKLPKLSNQKYNDYLKLIETATGIRKHLTTHVARHTFATYLLNKDIPIETVSKAVGHTSIKQTQHYAKLLGKKVVSDMKKLL